MQTLRVDQLVGRTLGEYQIERLLGQGQLGTAYLARQRSGGRTVIMTLFNLPQDMSAEERGQMTTLLAQERAALVRLTHPTIPLVYDLGEHAGSLYLVTAVSKGASLAQVLKQQGRFSPQQTLGILKQVAAGLDYAHSQGVVHGSLSLSNVFLSRELSMHLTGFGLRTLLAVYGKRPHMRPQTYLFSAGGTCLGNPKYISPEGVLGQPADARSDIYALGVMLFELLSGTPPFRGATPLDMALQRLQQPVPSVHAACPDVPEALDLVLSKTLERDPAKRFRRAGESAAAFERVLTGDIPSSNLAGDTTLHDLINKIRDLVLTHPKVRALLSFVHRLILDNFASLGNPLPKPELLQHSQAVSPRACSACGYQAERPEARFCPRCGRSLVS